MKTIIKQSLIAIAVSSVFVATTAHATNGYFSHGYGTKNKGLAGGGVALSQDAMAAATNPAGMVWVGNRMDIGAAIFSPSREYTVSGDATPDAAPAFDLTVGTVESDSNIFVIPHFARNWMLDDDSSIGLSVYGNGGMNTDYPGAAAPGGTYYGGPAGVDLSQLFINTTLAKKLDAKSSVGISLIAAYQRFKATGLGAFAPFSSDGANLTDVGYDYSFGYGAKIGWQSEVNPGTTVAISYQTKMSMDNFSKYAGLYAEQGGFDIPSSWTMGLAYDTSDKTTLTFDIQKINYTDVPSISNPFIPNIQTAQLGNATGAGFGWEDMTIYKLGYQWSTSEDWTWRAGYSHGKQPIGSGEIMFNILAPAVMETHITGGFTVKTDKDNEFTFAAMYSPGNDATGPNFLSGGGGAPDQTLKIEMVQWELEASYAWKY